MPTSTTNYGWQKPDIGASTDAWGGLLNTDLDGIDATVKSVSNAALPTAGGTMTGALSIAPAGASAVLGLNKPTASFANAINAQTAGSMRWQMMYGNGTAEGGSNAGSDYAINAFSDAGAALGTPLSIERKTGYAAFNANGAGAIPASGAAPGHAAVRINKSGSGLGNYLQGFTNSVIRWQMALGETTAEGGSNAGSNFQLTGYTDAGVVIGTAFTITRSNFNAQLGASLGVVGGYFCQSGVGGTQRANRFNIDFTTGSQLWIDATNTGTITVSSDYRIKKDVADLPSMWERAKALRPISYTHQDFTPPVELQRDAEAKPLIVGDDVERWGFIAHELQETLIQDAATGEKDSPTHIQSPNPWTVIATLTKALQEAMARIEALEAARG